MQFGCGEDHKKNWKILTICLCLSVIFAFCIPLSNAEESSKHPVLRNMVRKLKNMPAKDAKDMLSSLNIGKDINLLPHNSLIVTADSSIELTKASSLLKIADSEEPYAVTTILSSPNPQSLPSSEEIASLVGNVIIGTFLNPPSTTGKTKVIIDLHNSDLIIVGPQKLMNSLSNAVMKLHKSRTSTTTAKPKPEPSYYARPVKAQTPKPTTPSPVTPQKVEVLETTIDVGLDDLLNELGTSPAASSDVKVDLPRTYGDAALSVSTKDERDFFGDDLFDILAESEANKPKPVEPVVRRTAKPVEPVEPTVEVRPIGQRSDDDLLNALKALAAMEKRQKEAVKKAAKKKQAAEEAKEPIPVTAAPTPRPEKKPPVRAAETRSVEAKPEIIEASKTETVAEIKEETPVAKTEEPESKPERIETEIAIPRREKPEYYIPQIDGKTGHTELPLSESDLEITITLPEKVTVLELIELVGKQLQLNYVYDPLKIKGDFMLRVHDGKIKMGELYDLLENIMKAKNFVMIRHGNLVNIVPVADAANYDPVIRDTTKPIKPGDMIVTTIFRPEYTDIGTVQNLLVSMSLGSKFYPIPASGTIMVTDYSYRMKRIEELVKMIDIPGKARIFRTRHIEYLTARQMADKINMLSQQLETLTVTVSAPVTAKAATPVRSTAKLTPAQLRAKNARDAATRASAARAAAAKKATAPKGAPAAKGVYLDADERTNRLVMIGTAEELKMVEELIDTFDLPQEGLKYIREYVVKHVDPAGVVDTLNILGVTGADAEGPSIAILEGTNTLLVNATAEQHASMQMVIGYVDVEREDFRTTQQYEIQYVGAEEVLNVLVEMGIAGGTTSSRSSSSRPSSSRTPTRPTTATASKATGALSTTVSTKSDDEKDQPVISVLLETNSLLVKATPDQHKQIALVIAFADAELDESANPYVVYPLENQNPVDLADTINNLLEKTITTSSKSSDGKIQTRTIPKQGEDNEDITIIPDEPTNSLIVAASKKNQNLIAALIRALDVYRPQVLLDVTLVEITKDDLFSFDLKTIGRRGGFESGGTFDQVTSPFSPELAADKWGKNIIEGAFDGTNFTGFYADSHIQSLLETIDDKGYGRVLARPSILVRDNQEGSINTTATIYIAEEKTIVTSNNEGPPTTSTNVEFKDYKSGIRLTITPQVASADLLQLHIELKRTDFQGEIGETVNVGGSEIPKPLDTIESEVITDATIPNGATIILGGIETINQRKDISKVPILGDIPLIGLLFRGIGETDKQSRLYVFVKAHIIKPSDALTGHSDIERISRKKRLVYEEAEARFQGLESIPGIKPNPLYPEMILEDDEYLRELLEHAEEQDRVEVNISLD